MPWTPADATRHTKKATTDKKKRQWAHVANSALKRGASEASAIRQANAAVAGTASSGDKDKKLKAAMEIIKRKKRK